MDYKPYTIEWSRKRELQQILYNYLEDKNTSPKMIGEDICDILEDWMNEYSSRVDKAQELRNIFK